MKRNGHTLLLAVIIAALPASATAETFFQWTDASGVVHFTNMEPAVPTGQAAVRVVVDAAPRQPPTASDTPVSAPPVRSSSGPPVVSGPSPWQPAYGCGGPYADECTCLDADTCGSPYVYPGVAVGYRGPVGRIGAFHARAGVFRGRMRSVGHLRARR